MRDGVEIANLNFILKIHYYDEKSFQEKIKKLNLICKLKIIILMKNPDVSAEEFH
jgi:hypothetical protein